MRAKDIVERIKFNIARDVETFSETDKNSGYAESTAKFWNELPKNMTDEEAREYLGIVLDPVQEITL